MIIDRRLLHVLNRLPERRLSPTGRTTEVRLSQCAKAAFPIEFTLLGTVTDFRLEQCENAPPSIVSRLLGSSISFRLVQPLKAIRPIDWILPGIVMVSSWVKP